MAKRFKEERKKSGCFSRLILTVLCLALSIFGLLFCTGLLDDAQVYFLKCFYPVKYSEQVQEASEKYGLDQALIYAVIRTESGFDANAKSSAGAMGLMQMMPSTFQHLQEERGESLEDEALYDPEISIDYGCYYIADLLDYYKNEDNAVASYNAGYVVSEWLKNNKYSSDGKNLETIPYKETEDYVKKVSKAKDMYNKLYFSEK